MGIIISSFVGCGKTFFTNQYSDRIKIEDVSDKKLDEMVDYVTEIINDRDIVFIPSSLSVRELFEKREIDYDVFYPSKERRLEFIENLVRKRVKSDEIREFDVNFERFINEIDGDRSKNCYKHKLSNPNEFIGNSSIILEYINKIVGNHD